MAATSVFPEATPWPATVALLEQCLMRLQARAPVAEIAQLREYLPGGPGESQRLILVELIKFDLAAAAELGVDRRLADYLAEFNRELPESEIPADLVLEELLICREAGFDIRQSAYLQQFPHLQEVLANWGVGANPRTIQPLGVSSAAPPELVVGSKIAEFRILRRVGHGAFASVYLALQESLQRLVALKVSQRGSEEPQTLSQLDHPNIVRVYDERNQTDPPLRLLYMQFVGGGTLGDCLKRVETIPLPMKRGEHLLKSIASHLELCGLEVSTQAESHSAIADFDWPATVIWVGVQLAEGLDYAHRRGVIHRDVKPANILFAVDATPRLADFNVSYSGLTGRAGAAAYFGGSLAYMSPEQLEVAVSSGQIRDAADLDGRSDLFSLGVVLWEMLHGSRPWPKDGIPESWTDALAIELEKRRQAIPPPSAEQAEAMDARHRILDTALRRCLAFDRENRPASGRELANTLKLALNPRIAQRLYPRWRGLSGWLARQPAWLVLTAGALLPNLIAAVFNFYYNSSQIVHHYPDLWTPFSRITWWVNGLLFPIGTYWAVVWIVAHVRNVGQDHSEPPRHPRLESSAQSGERATASRGRIALFQWGLGHRVALLCGLLWLIAGLVFPVSLLMTYREFKWLDAVHFFSSLTICGGVAMVYPFFWITWVNLLIYFPRLVSSRLLNPHAPSVESTSEGDRSIAMQIETNIARWAVWLRRTARYYLLVAAAIPLVALLLLVVAVDVPRYFLLATIATTAAGFAASFLAVQFIDDFVRDLETWQHAPQSHSWLQVSQRL